MHHHNIFVCVSFLLFHLCEYICMSEYVCVLQIFFREAYKYHTLKNTLRFRKRKKCENIADVSRCFLLFSRKFLFLSIPGYLSQQIREYFILHGYFVVLCSLKIFHTNAVLIIFFIHATCNSRTKMFQKLRFRRCFPSDVNRFCLDIQSIC